MKKILIIIAVIAVASGGYYGAGKIQQYRANHASAVKKVMYRSTMNPNEISDKPGKDSMGMEMVPFEPVVREKKIRYRSTMNPNETSDKPGKDSMGMEMVQYEENPPDEIETPEGLASISIPADKRKMIGLSFDTVSEKIIFKEIVTPVKIVQDETRQFKVNTKVSGWIEKLFVNLTGQFVQKGAPLLSIYSPELATAQQEYLSALKAKEKLTGPAGEGMADSMDDLIQSARDRLRLYDISDLQVEQLRTTGKTERYMTLNAPSSGYITEKTVTAGQRIQVNDPLMMIVDLSVIWGEADIYETDIPYVSQGMPAEITLPYWPGKVFKGKVSLLNPFLSAETRTLKARIEIPNRTIELKPNMYGEAKLSYTVGRRIAVSQNAVMRTGAMDYVFKEGKGDIIIPAEVTLGIRSSDGFYEVISGLSMGDRIVSSANFLVDSESALKAAFKSAGAAK